MLSGGIVDVHASQRQRWPVSLFDQRNNAATSSTGNLVESQRTSRARRGERLTLFEFDVVRGLACPKLPANRT
jgi:hypothetical protein